MAWKVIAFIAGGIVVAYILLIIFAKIFCFFTEATEFKRRNASHCGSRWDRISN